MNVTSHHIPKFAKKLSLCDFNKTIVQSSANDNYANKIYFKDRLYVNGKFVSYTPSTREARKKPLATHEILDKKDLIELIWQGGFYVASLPIVIGVIGFILV
jgi:hypothetical protein